MSHRFTKLNPGDFLKLLAPDELSDLWRHQQKRFYASFDVLDFEAHMPGWVWYRIRDVIRTLGHPIEIFTEDRAFFSDERIIRIRVGDVINVVTYKITDAIADRNYARNLIERALEEMVDTKLEGLNWAEYYG